MDSPSKKRGNGPFDVVSTWNPRGAFVGESFFRFPDVINLEISDVILKIKTHIPLFSIKL